MTPPKSRSTRVTILLVLLPVWLLGSGAGALWYYFHREKKEAAIEQERFPKEVSIPDLEDNLRKLVTMVGERNSSTSAAEANLSRAASMIEGSLGPSNIGFPVKRINGPAKWPIFQVTLQGKKKDLPAVWIITSYDSPRNSVGVEANATGLASVMAAAQALATHKPPAPVHFVFLPHSNDRDSPVAETALKLVEQIKAAGAAKVILHVEAMGRGDELWIGAREIAGMDTVKLISGLGKVDQAKADAALSGIGKSLMEQGLPILRLSSTPLEAPLPHEGTSYSAAKVASSTGRLIELIRRLAPE